MFVTLLNYSPASTNHDKQVEVSDLEELTKILGISMQSTKDDVDNMIATIGKDWQCNRSDMRKKETPHSIRYAQWSRSCKYQNPSNLMQSQNFKIYAVGDTIYHIAFEDRIFDVVSVEQWKKQVSELKAIAEDLDESVEFKVLKTQDSSSQSEYKEIDAGVEVTIETHCLERPLNLIVSSNLIEQTNVKTARFVAEYAGYKGLCPEFFRERK